MDEKKKRVRTLVQFLLDNEIDVEQSWKEQTSNVSVVVPPNQNRSEYLSQMMEYLEDLKSDIGLDEFIRIQEQIKRARYRRKHYDKVFLKYRRNKSAKVEKLKIPAGLKEAVAIKYLEKIESFAMVFPKEYREEFLGDLGEVRSKLVKQGHSERWVAFIIWR
jgi:molybdenum cofactor biosynthesis enzyme MoaA